MVTTVIRINYFDENNARGFIEAVDAVTIGAFGLANVPLCGQSRQAPWTRGRPPRLIDVSHPDNHFAELHSALRDREPLENVEMPPTRDDDGTR